MHSHSRVQICICICKYINMHSNVLVHYFECTYCMCPAVLWLVSRAVHYGCNESRQVFQDAHCIDDNWSYKRVDKVPYSYRYYRRYINKACVVGYLSDMAILDKNNVTGWMVIVNFLNFAMHMRNAGNVGSGYQHTYRKVPRVINWIILSS